MVAVDAVLKIVEARSIFFSGDVVQYHYHVVPTNSCTYTMVRYSIRL